MEVKTRLHFKRSLDIQLNTLNKFFKKIYRNFNGSVSTIPIKLNGSTFYLKDIISRDPLLRHTTKLPFINGMILGLAQRRGYKDIIELKYDGKETSLGETITINQYTHVYNKRKKQPMKVRVKKKKDVDLKSIFPVIASEEFDLIAGMEFILDPNTVKKFERDGFLTLGDYKVSKDLLIVQKGSKVDANYQLILNKVQEKFIFSEDVVDILLTGINLNKSVILYGKGGHGKSEMTELILDELYKNNIISEKPFIQAFGDGLTEDRLFGGTDIKKYKAEGKIEYLLENSFLEHEVVVFEEIFDAPAHILLALKDVMTSGYYRNGNIQHKCKTKMFIGLTNKSKEDFAEKSDSLKALAERFPLTLKVEWDSYSKSNFIKLFAKVLGKDFYNDNKKRLSTLADIINLNNTNGSSFVSPRTAIHAASIYCSGKKLEYISDIDKSILKDYDLKLITEEFDSKQKEFIKSIDNYIENHELEMIDQDKEFFEQLNKMNVDNGKPPIDLDTLLGDETSLKVKLSKAQFISSVINRITPTPNNAKGFTTLNKKVNHIINQLKKDNVDSNAPTSSTDPGV